MRKFICLFLALILSYVFVNSLYADTSVLIDFAKLQANGDGFDPANSKGEGELQYNDHDEVNRKEHMPTLLDYQSIAGSNFTEDDLKGMKISLAAYRWDVVLNSSARHIKNQSYSYCKEWHTKFVPILQDIGTKEEEGAAATAPEGFSILGVRVKFPETPYNCWALIQPPYEIPAYENIDVDYKGNALPEEERTNTDNYGKKYEDGRGVVKNVGVIKSVDIRVYGCQFKNSLSVLLKDDNNIVSEYQMSQYLDFDGWRKLTWNNPNYINKAANRDLYIIPLYPRSEPYVKLHAFRIYRQGDQLGGDFVTYIKDVIITYDKAILDRENQPIDHESAWKILQERTLEARNREIKKIGHNQILRFIEEKKMHKESTSE